MATLNRAFQDDCKIYRTTGETSFSEGTETVIYEGKCDDQMALSIRSYSSSDVSKSDHAVYIRKRLDDVRVGDWIDITLQTGYEKKYLKISDVYARDMGTMLIVSETQN